MKRLVTFSAAMVVCIAALACPASSEAAVGDMTIGGKLGFATSPAPGLGAGFGVIFGSFAYQFLDNIPSRADTGLEGVGEIGYFGWWGNGWSVGNVPLFFMARYFYAVVPGLRLYGQAGLSINFWSAPGASEVDPGFVTGGGIEYLFNPHMGVGGDMRFNVVHPSWWDATHALFTVLFNYHILAPRPGVGYREEPVRRAPYHRR